MQLFKKYIKVITMCDEHGTLTPIYIIWNNGAKYKIDKILEVRKAASKVGGCGILYRCRIGKSERSIFYEINRWFIESTNP
ncbi:MULTISPECIES: hypothetical protein [unclassified Breznakia]|uniref:hypothetical protein n=1 Tax=unclassified Breznakia TaxID=2623764 RepID=UPI002476C113|nr:MULTISPECIES: hypothetical protein [unclassified Breznakia]MDH6367753.1 hypothetical protein [Breznakia sp. PH1-1]MDH6404841.1 hypothetical protein [Breznakia sp. PF1-11]MDH6412533.1 hypothetical protein [Breznakia sp. PFB1-11]MDH6414916.1 hypothetical protein [Breznakia sp. PFB1-14]MDH6417204.1 hypothetical protein [Breznakia sp. PFB1-4]